MQHGAEVAQKCTQLGPLRDRDGCPHRVGLRVRDGQDLGCRGGDGSSGASIVSLKKLIFRQRWGNLECVVPFMLSIFFGQALSIPNKSHSCKLAVSLV